MLDAGDNTETAVSIRCVALEAEIDLRMFGGSALTSDVDVPKERSDEEMGDGIPVTYVPARNTVFLSFALAWAEVLEADDIFIGVNALDYCGYPDCRPEYIEAYEQMANLATKRGVEGHRLTIHTPLIDLTKAEIIQRGLELGVDYALTRSCYDPSPAGEACGECDSCLLRLKGFAENGVADPAPYQRRRRLHDATRAPTRAAAVEVETFPVIEIFGPTIQGEGAEAGLPTHFVRLGGCDYRCSWCDTMYAVDPATVRANARAPRAPTRSSTRLERSRWSAASG